MARVTTAVEPAGAYGDRVRGSLAQVDRALSTAPPPPGTTTDMTRDGGAWALPLSGR